MIMENHQCVSVQAAAERLSISTKSIQRLIKSGELRAVKLGRRILIPESALCDLLNQHLIEVNDRK
jgi:excisionase family DNA binding protein